MSKSVFVDEESAMCILCASLFIFHTWIKRGTLMFHIWNYIHIHGVRETILLLQLQHTHIFVSILFQEIIWIFTSFAWLPPKNSPNCLINLLKILSFHSIQLPRSKSNPFLRYYLNMYTIKVLNLIHYPKVASFWLSLPLILGP